MVILQYYRYHVFGKLLVAVGKTPGSPFNRKYMENMSPKLLSSLWEVSLAGHFAAKNSSQGVYAVVDIRDCPQCHHYLHPASVIS